jgi:predicted amidohydrolase YtcJ
LILFRAIGRLAVLFQHIFAVDPMAILETKVFAKMLDGQFVYEHEQRDFK